MINFSKVMKSLFKEAPMIPDPNNPNIRRFVPPDSPKRIPNNNNNLQQRQQNVARNRIRRPARPRGPGGMGFQMEKAVLDGVLPRLKQGNYKHLDADSGASFAIKTDIYDDANTGNLRDNTHFSVKSKLNNDKPQKVHQTGGKLIKNVARKLQIQRGKNPVLDKAMDLYIGTNGNFVSPKDMQENHPQEYDAMMKHLSEQKLNIFNSLARYQQDFRDGKGRPNIDYDGKMIDKLVSHKKMGRGEDLSGPIDIRQLNGKVTDENFKDLSWFSDGKRFFLGEDENADTDHRMLDIWPIDEEGSSWSNREGDGGPQRDEYGKPQRGFIAGKREAGLPEPGQFKATMATNPEFLDKYFPKEKSFYMDDDGSTLGFKDLPIE